MEIAEAKALVTSLTRELKELKDEFKEEDKKRVKEVATALADVIGQIAADDPLLDPKALASLCMLFGRLITSPVCLLTLCVCLRLRCVRLRHLDDSENEARGGSER